MFPVKWCRCNTPSVELGSQHMNSTESVCPLGGVQWADGDFLGLDGLSNAEQVRNIF